MATISISQLDSASTMALGDLLEIAEPNAQSVSGYTSKKISIGSQLAPYIQGTVQNASLNTTNKTLVGAINEVDSEGVKWSENNVLGAKNLLNINGIDRTNQSITSVVNPDGTVTVNGTASGQGPIFTYNDFKLPALKLGDKIILSFEVLSGSYTHGASTSPSRIYLVGTDNNTLNGKVAEMGSSLSVGDKNSVTYEVDENCFSNGVCMIRGVQGYVRTGDILSNLKLGLMLRLESVSDDTFEPYAQTNVELTAEKMAWNKYAEYGVKNLIPYPWFDASGKSGRGITFEYNNEGYVTLDGTASTTSAPFFRLANSSADAVANGSYLKIKGGKKYRFKNEQTDNRIYGIIYLRNIDGTSPSGINIFIRFEDGTEVVRTGSISLESHSSCEFVVQSSNEFYLEIDIRVPNNSGSYSPSTAKARLIVTEEEVTDLSWMPYAMSNYELTLNKMDVVNIAPIEEGNSASKAYAIGDYMIWKRRFYKVTAAISASGAITEGTNVTKTTIGAELKAALNA